MTQRRDDPCDPMARLREDFGRVFGELERRDSGAGRAGSTPAAAWPARGVADRVGAGAAHRGARMVRPGEP